MKAHIYELLDASNFSIILGLLTFFYAAALVLRREWVKSLSVSACIAVACLICCLLAKIYHKLVFLIVAIVTTVVVVLLLLYVVVIGPVIAYLMESSTKTEGAETKTEGEETELAGSSKINKLSLC